MLYAHFLIALFGVVLTVNQEYRLNQPIYPGGLYYFQAPGQALNPIQPARRLMPWKAVRRGDYCRAYFNEKGWVAWVEIYEQHELVCRIYMYQRDDGQVFRRLWAGPDGRVRRREETPRRYW